MVRILSRAWSGIRFGDYVFSEPIALDRAFLPPHSSGLYVVLTPDPTWGPRDFQPLYFGEFASGLHRSLTATELLCLYRAAAGRGLYISSLTIPGAHVGQLAALKRNLIRDYGPIGNRDDDSAIAMEFVRRLETLERTVYQQEFVLKLALAALGQVVHPQVETKKRPAGFIRD